MPLDPSIALQVRPMADPLDSIGRAMTLRQLATQNELQGAQVQAQRDAVARQQRLRDLMGGLPASATDEDRITALRSGAFFDEADKLQAGLLSRDKTRAEIDKLGGEALVARTKATENAFDTQRKRLEAGSAVIGSVLARSPNPTHQDVYAAIQQAAAQYGLTPEEQSAMARGLPGDPAALGGWLRAKNAELLTAQQRLEMMTPKLQEVDIGGRKVLVDMNPNTRGAAPTAFDKTVTPDAQLSANVTMRGQNLTDARAREANALTREANATQIINDPDRGIILVNKGTGTTRQATDATGQPLPSVSTVKNQSAARRVMPLLDEAESVIKRATGSYVGAGVDLAARAVGASTPGAQAVAQLKVLEGNLMMAQPRMEGPQSNVDVLLYREMAGQIGDPTVPVAQKQAALKTIRALTEKYGGMQPQANAPAAPRAATPTPPAAGAQTDWRSAGYASPAAAVQDALNAIQQGADKRVVVQRLEAAGITNHGIR